MLADEGLHEQLERGVEGSVEEEDPDVPHPGVQSADAFDEPVVACHVRQDR